MAEHIEREAVTRAVVNAVDGGLATTSDDLVEVIGDVPAADVEPPAGWISVKDRVPETHGNYIVVACDEGLPYDEIIWGSTVVVVADYYSGCWTWEEGGTEYDLTGIVTHWMPLPEPPKEGEK